MQPIIRDRIRRPPNCPDVGDRCYQRGGSRAGVLFKLDDRLWAWVKWDAGGPEICHLYELIKAEN